MPEDKVNEKPENPSRRRFIPALVIGATAVAESALITNVATSQIYENRIRSYENQIRSYEDRLADLSKQLEETSTKIYLFGVGREDADPRYVNLVARQREKEYYFDRKIGEGFSQLPVFDRNHCVGSISEKTILDKAASVGSISEVYKKKVKEIMDEPFPTVDKETPLQTLISLLSHNSAILISDMDKIVGIVTKADLLKSPNNLNRKSLSG